MGCRIRHCVECPRCRTRYLVGFSPYENGSYLVPITAGCWDEWILHCSCGTPSYASRWNCNELKMYVVPSEAHLRRYGPEQEIVCIGSSRRSSSASGSKT
jgi:hypothetical protein